jgi:hypothetical protein
MFARRESAAALSSRAPKLDRELSFEDTLVDDVRNFVQDDQENGNISRRQSRLSFAGAPAVEGGSK